MSTSSTQKIIIPTAAKLTSAPVVEVGSIEHSSPEPMVSVAQMKRELKAVASRRYTEGYQLGLQEGLDRAEKANAENKHRQDGELDAVLEDLARIVEQAETYYSGRREALEQEVQGLSSSWIRCMLLESAASGELLETLARKALEESNTDELELIRCGKKITTCMANVVAQSALPPSIRIELDESMDTFSAIVQKQSREYFFDGKEIIASIIALIQGNSPVL